jgi:kinase suppressor of Ras 2
MKSLRPMSKHDSELPFNKSTDIYAFGTVWFELLSGDWPYKGLSPEAIIWHVGSGIRQPLPTLFSRDVKVRLSLNHLISRMVIYSIR